MEAIKRKLATRRGAVTYSDVLEELLSQYEASLETSLPHSHDQLASYSRQIMVDKPDLDGQLHICEEQQLRLLVQEVTKGCPSCHNVTWRMEESIMKGHVLCANIRCATLGCHNRQRWLSSSLISDRFTVNARYDV
jgi:hypothetical protein